jgi:hypothetical protein
VSCIPGVQINSQALRPLLAMMEAGFGLLKTSSTVSLCRDVRKPHYVNKLEIAEVSEFFVVILLSQWHVAQEAGSINEDPRSCPSSGAASCTYQW